MYRSYQVSNLGLVTPTTANPIAVSAAIFESRSLAGPSATLASQSKGFKNNSGRVDRQHPLAFGFMSFPFAIGCCPDRPMILASVEPSATQEHCRCSVDVDVEVAVDGDGDGDPSVWTMERFGDRCTQPGPRARCHWRVIKMYR